MQPIYIFTNNLFFKPKLEILAKQLDYGVVFLKSINELPESSTKIIADAEHQDIIEIAQKYPGQSYIFISHVKIELMQKLKLLGCTHVYPRSIFFTQFQKIIG